MKRGTRAAIYARISDDREGREVGVDDQIAQCRALAEREGLNILGAPYRDNDLSASSKARKARPEYERLLTDAKAGHLDVIMALSTSRLTRRPRENEDLIDLATGFGVRYRFIKSPSFDLNTADGRMIARNLAAADAAEAERTAERVRDNVKGRAERGEYHGGPRPYGYARTDDRFVLWPPEAAEIRRWYPLVLAGASLLGIAADLNRRGVPSTTGKPWRSPVIRKILLNPRNAGLRIHDDVERPAPHPAVVGEEVWRATRSLLLGRTGNSTARKHFGAGLYICKRCETRTVSSHVSRHGDRAYRCMGCWRSWRADAIDEYIVDLVAGIVGKEDARERLLPKHRKGGVDIEALTTERSAIDKNMKAGAIDYMTAKGRTRDALREGLAAAEVRLDEIEAALTEAGRTDALTAILSAEDPVAAWYAVQDVSRRQAVIRAMMSVTLGPPIRGRALWDPEKFISTVPR